MCRRCCAAGSPRRLPPLELGSPSAANRRPIQTRQGVSTDERLPALLRAAEQEGMAVAWHLEPYPGESSAAVSGKAWWRRAPACAARVQACGRWLAACTASEQGHSRASRAAQGCIHLWWCIPHCRAQRHHREGGPDLSDGPRWVLARPSARRRPPPVLRVSLLLRCPALCLLGRRGGGCTRGGRRHSPARLAAGGWRLQLAAPVGSACCTCTSPADRQAGPPPTLPLRLSMALTACLSSMPLHAAGHGRRARQGPVGLLPGPGPALHGPGPRPAGKLGSWLSVGGH